MIVGLYEAKVAEARVTVVVVSLAEGGKAKMSGMHYCAS